MQDTTNLRKKIAKYPKLILKAEKEGNEYQADFYRREMERDKERVATRMKNFHKNEKIKRKNGVFGK